MKQLALRRTNAAIPHCVVFVCVASLAVWGASSSARAEDDSTTLERRVKAAYLYKFTGYVDWPNTAMATSDAPFVIAVVGDDHLATELDRVCLDRTVNGHTIVVRRQNADDSIAGIHIAFVGRDQTGHLERILATAPTTPCLVVTEASDALKRGSCVNFVLMDERVRFEISQGAAEARGLSLSSRLLAVAVAVLPAVP